MAPSDTPDKGAPPSSSGGAAAQQQPPQAATSSGSGALGAAPPPDAAAPAAVEEPKENPWEVNKPVERRTMALNEEMHDCLYCFWSWITCGGPGARVRQLYVNGKLSRCMDDWARLKNCMIFKMDPEKDISVIPGPHPVWRIRTRKQAAEFWAGNYAHLREGGGGGGGGGGSGAPRGAAPPGGISGGADPDKGTLASPAEGGGGGWWVAAVEAAAASAQQRRQEERRQEERRQAAGKGRNKRSKRGRSESEDDEDWDDDGDYQDSEEEKKPAKKRSAAPRGKAAKQVEASESYEEDDDDDDEDAGEAAKLAAMNELERELYLFERDEKRERERERKQAVQQARKAKEKVEVRASSRRARPATGADSAIGKLAAARRQRERRAARRKEEEEDEEEEEGKEEEEEEEEEASDEGAAEPSTSEREEGEDAGAARRFGARGARAYDEGEGGGEGDEEEEEFEEVKELTTIHKMQLTRDMLEAWHNQPFFDEAVRGCVVRIVYGTFVDAAGVKQPNYLMMRVVEAQDRAPYRFTQQPGAKTSKYLVLEDGGHSKAMQMSMISTKPISQEELDRWNRHCERGAARKIMGRDANAAAAQIERAQNYKFTREDIQRKVAAKREKGEVVGGMVTEKARLRGLLEAAESAGDTEAAEQYKAKFDEIEAAQTAQKRAAAEAKAGMAGINERNRNINFEKALKNVGNRPDGEAGNEGGVDVFSRRQTQSKVYWQTGKKGEPGAAAAAPGGTPPPATPEKQQQGGGAAAAAVTHKLSRTMSKMDPEELLGVLSIDVDLARLPGGEGGGAAAEAAAARRMLGGGRWQLSEAAQQLAAGLAGGAPQTVVTLSEWLQRAAVEMAPQ
ncbi:MAG: hypothetical protein J3K34DRAFT_461760 [Monoraphidium minutum]|nr:MAG: hypothetical protein J3K34DRAFT_461760 [Monoraphidium minutum]